MTSSTKNTYKEISFKDNNSLELQVTTLADCVPLVSVSHNIPLQLTITTTNWTHLPIFDTKHITFLTSQKAEDEFYNQVSTYGFVENYYTQMLLSLEDIRILKSKNYGLYLGLQNQADLVQYYEYLLGTNRFVNENERLGYSLMERTTMFLRTEPCDEKLEIDRIGFYDKCERMKSSCYAGCGYYAYYSEQWVAIITDVSEFLNPLKGEDWVLLHEVGHNYNIAPYNVDIVGFGETGEVWNNIYGALYQQKFSVKVHWINESAKEGDDTIKNYQKGIPLKIWDWRPKLHFYMSIFGFDGTDGPLREFHFRHYQHSEHTHMYFNNIVPHLLEVFLDLHNVNLLPYLQKVVDFEQPGIPFITEELQLRLMSGHAVMPAIDFGLKPNDLQPASKEHDFRLSTPLILLPKVPKKYVWVKFNIKSPILLTGVCLYLNNNCHRILGNKFTVKLLADVYSTFILMKDHENLYLSDIQYHTISDHMKIDLEVQEIAKEDVYLPLVHYTISTFDNENVLLSQAFVDYKKMKISISQLPPDVPDGEQDKPIFELFNEESRVEDNFYKISVNDSMSVTFGKVKRMEINGKAVKVESDLYRIIFTPIGIQNMNDMDNFEFIQNDVERIKQFVEMYKIDLSGNELCQEYLNHYARKLETFNPNIEFPKEWLGF